MTPYRKRRLIVWSVSGALLAGGAGGTAWYLRHNYNKGRLEPEWRELCATYTAWFRPFDQPAESAEMATLRQQLSGDPYLKEQFLDRLEAARRKGHKFDPRALGGKPVPYAEQANHPPHGVETKQRVNDSLKVMKGLEEALAKWPAVNELAAVQKSCEARGWTAVAKQVEQAIAAARPGAQLKLDVALPKVLALKPRLAAIEADWEQVRKQQAALGATNDKVLAKFQSFAESKAAAAGDGGAAADPVQALADQLAEVKQLGEQLVAFASGPEFRNVDRVTFERRSQAHAAMTVDAQTYRTWLVEVKRYPKEMSPDPRAQFKPEAALAAVDGDLSRLVKLAQENKDLPAAAPAALQARVAAAKGKIAELQKLSWDGETRPGIEQSVAELDGELRQLSRASKTAVADADEWVATRLAMQQKSFGELVATLRGRNANLASPALSAVFEKQRDLLVAKIPDGNVSAVVAARTKLDALRVALEKLLEEFPAGLDLPAKHDWNNKLAAVLQPRAAERREAALKSIAEALAFDDGTLVRDAAFEARWTEAKGAFATFAGRARQFAEGWNGVVALMDQAYGPSEEAGRNRPTIEQAAAAFPEFAADPEVRAALKDVLGRLEALREVDELSAVKPLMELATVTERPEVARAAWRRLTALEFPPPKLVGHEFLIRERLVTFYQLMPDEKRRQALLAELETAGLATLARLCSSSGDEAAIAQSIGAALTHKARFKFGQRDRLTPAEMDRLKLDGRARFNCLLVQARDELKGPTNLPDDAARQRVKELMALLPAEGVPPAFTATLNDLAKENPAGPESPAAAGPLGAPVKIPWEKKVEADALTLNWSGHTLRFVRVDGGTTADGRRVAPFFIASTETSVGLVRDVLKGAGKRLADAGLPRTEPNNGPRGWDVDATVDLPKANDYWLPYTRAVAAYPEALAARSMPDQRDPARSLRPESFANPSPLHPMQWVPPESAMTIAAMLGCRLPTAAEWSAAAALQASAANLRDATWEKQRQHVVALRHARKQSVPWPDAGMFVPIDAPQDLPQGASGRAWSARELADRKIPAPANGDDETLFFRPVDAGEAFGHLVGNVSEFVWDAPEKLEQLPDVSVVTLRKILEAQPSALGVVGGSAISPPSIGIDRQPVDPTRWHMGFADVGFRLAFTAGRRPVIDKLRDALDEQKLIPADSAGTSNFKN